MIDEKLPVYELVLDEEKGHTIEKVSLVDAGAIMTDFIAFNQEGTELDVKFQTLDAEQRVVFGPAMIPDVRVVRIDDKTNQKYYLTASVDTVAKMSRVFMQKHVSQPTNVMHDNAIIPEDVYVWQSFVTNKKMGIETPSNFRKMPYGTWFIAMQLGEDSWNHYVKTGMVKAFSIEGVTGVKKKADEPKGLIDSLNRVLSGNK